ncbi:asparagine synthase (glutamine-hydrolysing) [Saccharopolyspora antimicrobica]|uniref:asparagine synthase (glutamine-hydrolyzing) n=1 Tax=Saccharopolyspora antimicrobica TaxID=455193 RepID=A0A1I5C6L7_9PSEU|nr:asparagine synthase (glutamine-hydrolyzing) [Saccharopolyspora antimicrobica]RKT88958.1 asparagine synthase (glutamine-hydrolysing) [Saccharopolyspora antimicrobica]SFN82476.1 asparagine synthase (glutamine-hydrolysing) [Saccharopolyspora antimicrobica]
MCGIAGWVSFDADLTHRGDALDAMTGTMSCRGPDSGGTYLRTHVGLGHRRLAVIDLPGGTQPMSERTPAGDVVLVYSGEVYNFQELRDRLKDLGHAFRTDSDTEVVLRSYLEWGESFVDHLDGMYAFAIWDERDQKLVLVRDRMGIKPLFYHPTPDGVLFGSEPKAVLANPLVRKVVDTDGLRELFAQTKTPGWALWKGLHEMLPGTLITVSRNGIQQRTYWRLSAAEHTDGQEDTVARVRELLTGIIDRQLISDVPQCVLLSGGLDSSAITGFAAERLALRGEQVRSFSVDFVGQEENFVPDEMRETPDSPFVRDVVEHVGSSHRDVVLDPAELSDPAVRRAAVAARDIPNGFGDLDNSLYLLFKAIREHSTVALSGESADEVFGGYPWLHREAAAASDTFPWMTVIPPLSLEGRTDHVEPGLRERLDVRTYTADQYATALAEVEHLDGESELDRRMRTTFHLHLTRFVRSLLDRKDRLSMAVGLEVRVPFCNHRLVEYVYNAPWSLKTFDGREKSLLRHAAAHVMPRSVVERVKSPFPSTQNPGYAAILQQQVKELVADPGSQVFALIDRLWAQQAVAQDPARMSVAMRGALERVLDVHTWLELHSPELQLD